MIASDSARYFCASDATVSVAVTITSTPSTGGIKTSCPAVSRSTSFGFDQSRVFTDSPNFAASARSVSPLRAW